MASRATRAPQRQSPRSPKRGGKGLVSPNTMANTLTFTGTTAVIPLSQDPEALLDALDKRNIEQQLQLKNTKNKDSATPFDPIEFLNQHYESEKILSQQLPGLRDSVARRMEILNDRISNALQRQSETAISTRRHVQDAKASCQALEHRILQVREKAALSERAVLEITAEMKRLDCAKRHLQRTITTLKRLHMLVHAVEQLRITSAVTQQQTKSSLSPQYPDYKNASHLIAAIRELLEHFHAYTAKVQPMRVLTNKVQDYQEDLRLSLVFGFREVLFGRKKALLLSASSEKKGKTAVKPKKNTEDEGNDDNEEDTDPVMSVTVMQGGVLFIDSLGVTTRKEFIHNLCQDALGDYVAEFAPPSRKPPPKQEEKRISSFKKVEPKPVEAPPKPQSSMDQIEQRYSWFLNGPLLSVKSKFPGVFPPHWNLQACLVAMFLQLTRDHILALLDGPRKDPDASNATILLKALQKTILFEKDITAWLERECGTVFDDSLDVSEKPRPDGEVAIKPLTGIASRSFQNYMDPYIRLEEQSMDEQLAAALEDRTVDTRGERPVFISSTNLFVYIKGSITRCTALTKGYPLFLLYRAFKDSLKKYAQILNTKLPTPTTTQNAVVVGLTFGKQDKRQSGGNASYHIPAGEEVTVCHVISTCEYCADTMEALEDLIRDTIDEQYKAKIDMISDQEQFHDITAKSIRVLVAGLTNRLESALKEMASVNWGAWDSVAEESAYVMSIHEQVEPFVKTVKQLLPTSYFRSFCDKFVIAFTSAYYESVVRQKRISEPGTQQIQLDLYNLKTLFLRLPVLEDTGKKSVSTGASIAPAMYTKMVQKQFGRMETILKLVGTPTDLLIENFKVQWPGGSAADFSVVLSLKGMKRNEQASMLEKMGFNSVQALKGAASGVTSATIVSERVQLLQDQGQNVAEKVNKDLSNMRQKVDEFRKTFR